MNSHSIQATSSGLSASHIEIEKLKLKLKWLSTDVVTFKKRLALHKTGIHDEILISDVIFALKKVDTLYQHAAETDFSLGKLFHEQTALLRSVLVKAAHSSFLALQRVSPLNPISIVVSEMILTSQAIYSELNFYPTESSHLKSNAEHLIEAENNWAQFITNYQELSKKPLPLVEAFHANIQNHINNLKVQYNMHLAEHYIKLQAQGEEISTEVFKLVRKSLKQAKRLVVNLPQVETLQQKISALTERLKLSHPHNIAADTSQTIRSSTLNTFNSFYNSNGQIAPFADIQIAAEKEYFYFNEISVVDDPENYQPEKFLGIDLDETLLLTYTNGTFRLIAEDKLIAFLKELNPNIKVSIITARYYPEKDILVKAGAVVDDVNQKVGRPVISSIIFTNAVSKVHAMLQMEKRYFYMDLKSQRNNLSHTDDREEIINEISRYGFKAIRANTMGHHIAALRQFVGLQDFAPQVTASTSSAVTATPTKSF